MLEHPVAALARLALVLLVFAPFATPRPSLASNHLNEITKILAAYEGDSTIQAVELRMLFNGENLVDGTALKVYDGAGVVKATLGTFSSDLPAANALTGRTILLATMKFRQRFGVTPDLQISPGIPLTTGQVAFENVTCFINAIAYGAVTSVLNGATAAPPIPRTTQGAVVLLRTIGNAIAPACPLGEDAASRFVLRTVGPGQSVNFTNNSGQVATVASTATSVETLPSSASFRIAPNPIRGVARIESPRAGRIAVYDSQGRRVRTIRPSGATATTVSTWNATDDRGRPLASGVYYLRLEGSGLPIVRRFVVMR